MKGKSQSTHFLPLFFTILFSKPSRMSVFIVLSCASSNITTEYLLTSSYLSRSGSWIASLSSIPSVKYLSTVFGLVLSSKRIE